MKHKLLLIGDSIRRSYQPCVVSELVDTCDIVGVDIGISCNDTRTTLALFDDVIAGSGATIIHWNNGLHDVKKAKKNSLQCAVPIEEYKSNIEKLFAGLNQTAPGKIIWARTTPVIEQRHNSVKTFCRFNKDIDAYNNVADAFMTENGIMINDLHGVIAAEADRYIREDGVHLVKEGRLAAAHAVVAAVLSCLAKGK